MKSRTLGIAALGLLFAMAAGGFQFSRVALSRQGIAAEARSVLRTGEITRLRDENRRLLALVTQPPALPVVADRRAAPVEQEARVMKEQLRLEAIRDMAAALLTEKIPAGYHSLLQEATPAFAISRHGQLDAHFGELFELEPAEVALLQETLTKIVAQLEEARANSVRVRLSEPNAVVLELAPIPGAADFREQFLGAMRQTLGEERLALWQILVATTINGGADRLFGSFGAEAGLLAISRSQEVPYFVQRAITTMPIDSGDFQSLAFGNSASRTPRLYPQPRLVGLMVARGPDITGEMLGTTRREEAAELLGPLARFLPAGP